MLQGDHVTKLVLAYKASADLIWVMLLITIISEENKCAELFKFFSPYLLT